ncbi:MULTISPECIES: tRNA uridine-5-carboxymethylaminomethyl(34) synthesis GTPase MnmE [Lachnospira]|jgi:tRNA modification GTPase|uniref:tRNA modification GTPase MnmE n=1 Tax=Lachnospira pectinoschiza TaxID=28052 RepID=A0A1G9YMN3_9FIRM|nr:MULTISPECIES: tRNA uridine-5-carboxymethylaminomethyl(34) synthesis GTPase MnmE [Lachnospira]MBQ2473172.1 tRNA uridine-5-carboxymethylaminomethyl(34) synthesis GTPase MnmE [Lachnospira sp.]SDN10479.1 tRNA modification GTPase [Lachnospira pectinoschiza]
MVDTIAAISTSTMSSGGISIIRVSGSEAIDIVDSLFLSKKNIKLKNVASHTVHYGNIVYEDKLIDEVLVIVMKAPNTYTREDIVEIDCHGGILVTKRILEIVLKSGARLAEPGEFTKRAFLNGRIDLSQAEAVIDIINAKNDLALKSSVKQLNGKLSEKIKGYREIILNNVAFIEAALDDPEHIDINDNVDKMTKDVDNLVDNVNKLLKTFENGRIIHDGISTVILGKTNAGKSSLLNVLARAERAIVTDIEGTTRDVLEESINLSGITLNLVDTAGIRKTDDIVENIGVQKAKKYAVDADLVIYVVDSTRDLDDNDFEIMSLIKDKKVLVLLNKIDLEMVVSKEDIMKHLPNARVVSISAKEEIGIDNLEDEIKEMFFSGNIQVNDEVYITSARHKQLLTEAVASLELVKQGIEAEVSEDFLTIDLMTAYEKLGLIVGEEVEDDLANRIFERFCMGK